MAEDSPAYYAIIPANVRYDKNLKANEKLLYGEITALCNMKGYCWSKNLYFANLYSVSKNTISIWINDLKKYGYINVEIIYKENSKEISDRYIRINVEGITKKSVTPITKNSEDNTTMFNTTINNTSNKAYMEDFEEWYRTYPRQHNKTQTYKNWKTTLKTDTKENIAKATKEYKSYIKKHNTEHDFIIQSTNFVGQQQKYKGYLKETDEIPTEHKPLTMKIVNL